MLNIYKLEVFATVVRARSFSQAAKRLLMTQSAISQHIQDLERHLGVSLFDRGPRGVTLTTAGETLHNYTGRILQLIADAEDAIIDLNKVEDGQIRIGATPGINAYILPGWIGTFQRRYQNIRVSIQTETTTEIIGAILEQHLSLGVVEGEFTATDYPALGVLPLREIELFVVIGPDHPCWYREVAPAHALNGQAFVARQQGSQTRSWFESILRRNQIEPHIIAEFDNPESIKHAVASGMGITILPEYAVWREVENGLLRAIPIENVPLQRTVKLLWNNAYPLDPIVRSFLRNLSKEFPQISTVH